MKIAVSGTAATGKTTLAGRLAQALGLPVIDEGYERLFVDPAAYNTGAPQLAAAMQTVLEEKRAREAAAGGFVADRCPIDLFHLWLGKNLWRMDEDTRRFHEACRSFTQAYDHVVIPSWGGVPLAQSSEGGAKQRVMNEWVQLRNHAAITGYAHLWLPADRIIEIPPAVARLEARVDFVLRAIRAAPSLAPNSAGRRSGPVASPAGCA